MKKILSFLPGFKVSYLIVSGLYIFAAGGVLLRGAESAMTDFMVPEVVLQSPHYQDAITWVYLHMLVIGLLIGTLGFLAKSPVFRMGISRFFLLAHILYTFLDFRTAEWSMGTGLYQGEGSLIPAFMAAFMTLFFLHLSISRRANGFPD